MTFVPLSGKVGIDPEALTLTRLTIEEVQSLMWDLGRPGAVSDITLLTRIEDSVELLKDALESLPIEEEE